MDPTSLPTNRYSIYSFIFSILLLLSCCGGVVPIPFTGFICFPLAFLFSLVSVIAGGISLRQIRSTGHNGSGMAWTGVVLGGLVLVLFISFILLIAGMLIFAPDTIPNPPYINLF
jgi:hypothetical protein